MFRNYFKIAVRNLWKNKTATFINVFGLTIGLTCCLLIGLYIQYEVRFDRFQPNGTRIARLVMDYRFDSSPETKQTPVTSTKVAPVFKRTFPEVEAAVRMIEELTTVRQQDHLVSEKHFYFVDSTFFDIFQAEFMQGNPQKALDGPHKVVLTESTARRYFGQANPIGQVLVTGADTVLYEVTGVIKDYPASSQLHVDFLASFSSLGVNQEHTYFNANYTTFLLLRDEQAFASLQAKIHSFMKKEMAGSGASVTYWLEPLLDIHLHSPYDSFVPNTPIVYLYILAGVALLILLIVCFTYINLSTARSMERAKEVGVRKVIGADKQQLFWQFIGESILTCLIAMALSLDLVLVVLPYFNELAGKSLTGASLHSLPFLLFLITITLVVSLLAGSYPALVLSKFQPVKVLKGSFRHTRSGQWLQQSLIVFQFMISIFLLVATWLIQNQLNFIQEKKLGYDRDHVVEVLLNRKVLDNLSTIKHELLANPDVQSITRCVASPINIYSGFNMRSATMAANEQIPVTGNSVDEDFLKTTGLQLVAGSDFTAQDIKDVDFPDWQQRQYHFILNERAARQLGWTPQEAIGKRMFLDDTRPGVVKGVVKDFHFESLHESIKPLVLSPEIRARRLLIKLSGQRLPETLTFLENRWKQVVPYMPFEYRFLEDHYHTMYQSEIQLGKVMRLFTSLSMILACLGLFGLTSFMVQQRIKEIGIRKVLGASIPSIIALLSGGFLRLTLLAMVLAFPLAAWAMHAWLEGFAYRVTISGWIFAGAALATLTVTLLTVSYQAIRAALMNPVQSLKSE